MRGVADSAGSGSADRRGFCGGVSFIVVLGFRRKTTERNKREGALIRLTRSPARKSEMNCEGVSKICARKLFGGHKFFATPDAHSKLGPGEKSPVHSSPPVLMRVC
jgi:hypothetical protein